MAAKQAANSTGGGSTVNRNQPKTAVSTGDGLCDQAEARIAGADPAVLPRPGAPAIGAVAAAGIEDTAADRYQVEPPVAFGEGERTGPGFAAVSRLGEHKINGARGAATRPDMPVVLWVDGHEAPGDRSQQPRVPQSPPMRAGIVAARQAGLGVGNAI